MDASCIIPAWKHLSPWLCSPSALTHPPVTPASSQLRSGQSQFQVDGAQTPRSSHPTGRNTFLPPVTAASPWQRKRLESPHRLHMSCKGKSMLIWVKKSDSRLTEWGDHRQHHQGRGRQMGVPPGGRPRAGLPITETTPNSQPVCLFSARGLTQAHQPHRSHGRLSLNGLPVPNGRIHSAETTQETF